MVKSRESKIAHLILAARDADSRLGELLTLYRPYLHLLADQAIGPEIRRREDASDILQQTECEAFQAFTQFRGNTEPEFTAWIKQILRRNLGTLFRGHRAAKRDVSRERSLFDGDQSASITWMQPAGAGPSPSQQIMRGEAALKLAAAIDSLPANQRDAVRLRHLENMKIDEVAAELKVSVGAAAGLIRRGVEALRTTLAGETQWL